MVRFAETADAESARLKILDSDHVPGDRPGYVDPAPAPAPAPAIEADLEKVLEAESDADADDHADEDGPEPDDDEDPADAWRHRPITNLRLPGPVSGKLMDRGVMTLGDLTEPLNKRKPDALRRSWDVTKDELDLIRDRYHDAARVRVLGLDQVFNPA